MPFSAFDPFQHLFKLPQHSGRTLPNDFLAYHQATLSSYRGTCSPVIETDEYSSTEESANRVLATIN